MTNNPQISKEHVMLALQFIKTRSPDDEYGFSSLTLNRQEWGNIRNALEAIIGDEK